MKDESFADAESAAGMILAVNPWKREGQSHV